MIGGVADAISAEAAAIEEAEKGADAERSRGGSCPRRCRPMKDLASLPLVDAFVPARLCVKG